MKVRLYTRSGVTLMEADAQGVSLPELMRLLQRGEVCVVAAGGQQDPVIALPDTTLRNIQQLTARELGDELSGKVKKQEAKP